MSTDPEGGSSESGAEQGGDEASTTEASATEVATEERLAEQAGTEEASADEPGSQEVGTDSVPAEQIAEEASTEEASAEDTTEAEPEAEEASTEEASVEDATEAEVEAEVEAGETDDAPPATVPAAPGVAWAGTGTPATLSSAGRRFGALLLDELLFVVTFGVGWMIWSLFTWSKGQSPAKSLLGMRCVRTETGRGATWGTMFLREFVLKWLLGTITGGITYLVSAFMILGASRQGIWDKGAKTVVVDDPQGLLVG